MCVFWHNVLRLKKVIYKHCCAICVLAKQKRKQRRAKRKKEARDNLTKEEILQDDRFFCIAGYTSGGAPYGVTWEEKDLKPWEDLEENE